SGGTTLTDTSTANPGSSANFYFKYIPKSNVSGQTAIITVNIHSLTGNCDSTLIRYLSVGYHPKAGFGFVPVCVGMGAVSFSDSSTVTSGFLSRSWNFGDGGV